MKRLLILVLSLLLVSLAPAGILELSINGATNGQHVDQATTLTAPSGTIMIGVSSGNNLKADWDLTVLGSGSIGKPGTLHIPPSPAGGMVNYTPSYPTYSAYVAFRVATDTNPALAGVWWDDEFHCDGPGVVIITLLDTGGNVLDTITVSQIPEPMTVALLGLGGLFLRRRK